MAKKQKMRMHVEAAKGVSLERLEKEERWNRAVREGVLQKDPGNWYLDVDVTEKDAELLAEAVAGCLTSRAAFVADCGAYALYHLGDGKRITRVESPGVTCTDDIGKWLEGNHVIPTARDRKAYETIRGKK